MFNMSAHAEHQVERMAMHVGLMAILMQRATPLSLVQQQAVSLRQMLKEVIDLEDERSDATVQIERLLPPKVADLLDEDLRCPDDPSGLFDGENL